MTSLTTRNPFIRGFERFTIRRALMIGYHDYLPPVYRAVHPLQETLSDSELVLQVCSYDDEVAFVIDKSSTAPLPDEMDHLPHDGQVLAVLHALYGIRDEEVFHLGDFPAPEGAQQAAREQSFATGVYSRTWEISTAHLPPCTLGCLADLSYLPSRPGTLFQAFRLPTGERGCRLSCTPWTEQNLKDQAETSIKMLLEAHRREFVPESLIQLLLLAGLADVRFLILDPDAPILEGLPIYSHD